MGFFKRNATLITFVCTCALTLQQIALRYSMAHRSSKKSVVESNENDSMIAYEINQLSNLWKKADIDNLLTLESIGNPRQLEGARARLNQAEIGIQESEKRVRGVLGKNREFFLKFHSYHRHSAWAFLDILDFLLAHEGEYSIIESEKEINFDKDSDGEKFRELLQQLSYLYQEKAELDILISKLNIKATLSMN